jgi:hypothetical protein
MWDYIKSVQLKEIQNISHTTEIHLTGVELREQKDRSNSQQIKMYTYALIGMFQSFAGISKPNERLPGVSVLELAY